MYVHSYFEIHIEIEQFYPWNGFHIFLACFKFIYNMHQFQIADAVENKNYKKMFLTASSKVGQAILHDQANKLAHWAIY